MIYLTEDCAEILQKTMASEDSSPEYVRFGVKGGGCSGFTYTIDFDNQQRKFDLLFESCGINVLVDKKSHHGFLQDFSTIFGEVNHIPCT